MKPVKSVAENISIKNNKLCETNPISGTPKMNLTHYSTNRYDNNSGLLTMQKRSQNEPNQTQFYPPTADLPAYGGFTATLFGGNLRESARICGLIFFKSLLLQYLTKNIGFF